MTAPDQQPHPPETFGCHYDCEFFSDSGVLSPEYCKHPSFEKPRKIIGFSSKSCEIPRGKTRPEWCPLCGVCKAAIAAAARATGAREERERIYRLLYNFIIQVQYPSNPSGANPPTTGSTTSPAKGKEE